MQLLAMLIPPLGAALQLPGVATAPVAAFAGAMALPVIGSRLLPGRS
jgi:hypothetical protein